MEKQLAVLKWVKRWTCSVSCSFKRSTHWGGLHGFFKSMVSAFGAFGVLAVSFMDMSKPARSSLQRSLI